MFELPTLSAQQISNLIVNYLAEYPEVGLKGLAEKSGISYDSLQKYAKASNRPPQAKWKRLWEVIGKPSSGQISQTIIRFDQEAQSEVKEANKPMNSQSRGFCRFCP
jgi:hypothetical protein